MNLSTVLTHLRQNAPVSRAALADLTGLNRGTITRLVQELIARRLVRETGLQSLPAGRPSILLELDPGAGCMMGAEIDVKSASAILTDLNAHLLWRQEVEFADGDGQEAVLGKISQLIGRAFAEASKTNRHILGLGLSLPELAEAANSVTLFAPDMHPQHLAVTRWLEQEFDLPIYVNKQTRMAALAESYFGSARGSSYVLYVKVAGTVGAALVINQRIVAGISGFAGEVGHMAIDPHGPGCNCGSQGCWETYVSAPAVAQRVRAAISAGKESCLRAAAAAGPERITVPLVAEAACAGDGVALAALEETGFYLGIGLANLINALNPQKVVLGGYISQAPEFLLPVIQRTVRARALRCPSEAAELVVATYERDAGLMGAVASVYGQMLVNPSQAYQLRRGPRSASRRCTDPSG